MSENLQPSEESRTFLTPKEAAEYLRVLPETLLEHQNEIPSHKPYGFLYYIKEELDELVRPYTKYGEFSIFESENGPTYLTLVEAAEYLNVSTEDMSTEYFKCIPSYEFFGHRLYKKKELDRLFSMGRAVIHCKVTDCEPDEDENDL